MPRVVSSQTLFKQESELKRRQMDREALSFFPSFLLLQVQKRTRNRIFNSNQTQAREIEASDAIRRLELNAED